NRSVADMKKKPTQQPTARWIFLRFGGIHEYRLGEAPPQVTELGKVRISHMAREHLMVTH
ncbi:hypothetical protein, partial [Aeromonas caviae]|uniref:hypothetical protein n=1 Tax=Aeromonas caviae TaxID=648 RepID=UPI001327BBD3